MRVRFEQVDAREKEQALIRAVEKTADILNAIDLLENGSGGLNVTKDYGDFKLDISKNGANYVLLSLYQKEGTEYKYKTKANTSSDTYTYTHSYNGVTLAAGQEFCIEISGHYGSKLSDYQDYETSDDVNTRRYYIRIVSEGHQVLINGSTAYHDEIFHYEVYTINAKNVVSISANSSWLKYEVDGNDQSGQHLTVSPDANFTGKSRTGTVTLSSGNATATLKVTQPDMTSRVYNPSNLSQTESSPTVISTNYFSYEAIGMLEKWEVKEGSTWTVMYDTGETDTRPYNDIEYLGDTQYDKWFVSGKTYRLTIYDRDGHSNSYYVKAGSSSNAYVKIREGTSGTFVPAKYSDYTSEKTTMSLQLNSSASWTATSNASWLTVSPTSGTSGNGKSLSVTAAANTSGAKRTGTITFKQGSTSFATYIVTQSSAEYLAIMTEDGVPVETSSQIKHVPGKASSNVRLIVFTDGTEAAISTTSDWITVPASTGSDSNGKQIIVRFTENTTGKARTGSITFKLGGTTKTVSVTQEPTIGIVTLSSPVYSTNKDAPTVTKNDGTDITFKWNQTSNSIYYKLIVKQIDGTENNSYTAIIYPSGTSQMSLTVPGYWFDPLYTGIYRVRIYGYDAYGNSSNVNSYYMTRTVGDAVYLNRKTAQEWKNAGDVPCNSEYVVASASTWTASSSASWITLSKTSGASGDVLKVSLQRNTGAVRSGTVTVKCGSATAKIAISQCAALSEYPNLKTPNLSKQIETPTVLPKTSTLTVTWNVEPQASSYRVTLNRVKSANNSTVLQNSKEMYMDSYADKWNGTGTYTFTTSDLTEGQIYKITFLRSGEYDTGKSHITATSYYFTFMPNTSFLTLNGGKSGTGEDAHCFYADGGEDSTYYTVTSSGTWSATVSDSSWMMVAAAPKDAEYLAEHQEVSAWYASYTGNSGGQFCLSVLENTTGNTRTGTVTVSTPGTSVTFNVVQQQAYEKPELVVPSFGTIESAATEIAFANVNLQWSSGQGNTGKYTVTVYEKNDSGSYSEAVWTSRSTSSLSATIPSTYLKADTKYKLRLETVLVNTNKTVSRTYYFRTGSVNQLTLNADVDWSQMIYGGYVNITASATGGAGGYQYAYQLLLKNLVEQETPWGSERYYQFLPKNTGNYSVKVFVKDSAGKQATYVSTWDNKDSNLISVAVPNEYTANLDYTRQIITYTVISSGGWNLTECPEWITPSLTSGVSGDTLSLGVDRNNGAGRTGVLKITGKNGISSTVTISQGICWGIPRKGNRSWDFLHAADNMLYRVKKFSRNNYCVGGLDETEDVTMGTAL